MNWAEIGRGSGKDENRVKVGWVEGGRYFVGGFKCARNYVRAKRVGASSFFAIYPRKSHFLSYGIWYFSYVRYDSVQTVNLILGFSRMTKNTMAE